MNIVEYKESLQLPLRQASLCFFIKDGDVLLAMKKRGFGKGRWNGVGGKPNSGENIESAAKREAREEIGVTPKSLDWVATLNFYFPHNSDRNQQVVVFFTEDWDGEPTETEEMSPKWFKRDQLPFDSMWPDDIHWLPLVFGGKRLEAEFLFGENDVLLDLRLSEIKSNV